VSVPASRHRFTADDFLRLADAGILEAEARVELLDGEIYEMPPIGPDHSGALNYLGHACFARVGPRCIVSIQGPLVLEAHTQVQPDIALLRPADDFYRTRLPRPDDVLLVVEVARQSLRYDRAKLRRYAAAGIAEAWLVDLSQQRVEAHRAPSETGYRDVRVLGRGESLASVAFPDAVFTVDEILG
jgi:Uma2 family endonuclease